MTNNICRNCNNHNPQEANFCMKCGSELSISVKEDELRDVAVLFADIKGFTSLSEKLSPDILKETIDELFISLTKIIEKYNGKVIKYEGDLIMAAFGIDVSTVFDIPNACKAALNMKNHIERYSSARINSDISMRIGIHYGNVAVGLIGNRQDIMGDTVNIAARMEQNAPNGEIMITEEVSRFCGNDVILRKLPAVKVKGKSDYINVYIIDKIPGSEINTRKYSDIFLNIDNNSEKIKDLILSEESSRILITGSSGTGKTRLVSEALKEIYSVDKKIYLTRIDCNRFTTKPYFLINEILNNKFNIYNKNDLKKIWEDYFKKTDEDFDVLSNILDNNTLISKKNISPEKSLARIFDKFSEKTPHIILIEDIHLSDLELVNSLSLFTTFSESNHKILITGKDSEIIKKLSTISSITIELKPFSEKNLNLFLKENKILVNSHNLKDIYRITHGIPFIIQEFIESMINRKLLIENDSNLIFDEKVLAKIPLSELTEERFLKNSIDSLGNDNIEFFKCATLLGDTIIPERISDIFSITIPFETFNHALRLNIIKKEQNYYKWGFQNIKSIIEGRISRKHRIKLHTIIGDYYNKTNYLIAFRHYIKAENLEKTQSIFNVLLEELDNQGMTYRKFEVLKEIIELENRKTSTDILYRHIAVLGNTANLCGKSQEFYDFILKYNQELDILEKSPEIFIEYIKSVTFLSQWDKVEKYLLIFKEKNFKLLEENKDLLIEYIDIRGLFNQYTANYDEAIKDFEKVEEIAETIDNTFYLSRSLFKQSQIHEVFLFLKKMTDNELKTMKKTSYNKLIKSLSISENNGHIKNAAGACLGLVRYYACFEKDLNKQILYVKKALELYKKCGDIFGIGHSYSSISFVYLEMKKINKAYEYCYKSLRVFKNTNDIENYSLVLNGLFSTLIRIEKGEKADLFLKKSVEYFKHLSDYRKKYTIIDAINFYSARKKYDIIDEIIDFAEKTPYLDIYNSKELIYQISFFEFKRENIKKAVDLKVRLIELIKDKEDIKTSPEAVLLETLELSSQGKIEPAYTRLCDFREIFIKDHSSNFHKLFFIDYNIGVLDVRKGNLEKGRSEMKKALDKLESINPYEYEIYRKNLVLIDKYKDDNLYNLHFPIE